MRSYTIRSAALLAGGFLCACTNVFLQPDRVLYSRPESVGATYETIHFRADDGIELTAFWFPAARSPVKGTVIQFHGNGENITSHYLYVYWLALEGWNVMTFDYRGYGASGGSKSVSGAVRDSAAALSYARTRTPATPLAVIGQSMGGALALAGLVRDGGQNVRVIVLDSTFSSYRRVARTNAPWPQRSGGSV